MNDFRTSKSEKEILALYREALALYDTDPREAGKKYRLAYDSAYGSGKRSKAFYELTAELDKLWRSKTPMPTGHTKTSHVGIGYSSFEVKKFKPDKVQPVPPTAEELTKKADELIKNYAPTSYSPSPESKARTKTIREERKRGNPAYQKGGIAVQSTRGSNLKSDYQHKGESNYHPQLLKGEYGTKSARKHEYVVIGYTWNGDKVASCVCYGQEGVRACKKDVHAHYPHKWLKFQQHNRNTGKGSDHFGKFWR